MNILIFGATGGIGQLLASNLADSGHTIIIHGRNEKRLTKLYDDLAPKTEVLALPIDFLQLNPAHASEYVDLLKENVGTIDAVYFCSGYYGQRAPLVHMGPHEWIKMQQINLNAPFLLTRALWKILSPEARVVYLLSPEAFDANMAMKSGYGASKMGLKAVVSSLIAENANTSVEVIGYDPMYVATALHHNAYPGLPNVDHPALAANELAAMLGAKSGFVRRKVQLTMDQRPA